MRTSLADISLGDDWYWSHEPITYDRLPDVSYLLSEIPQSNQSLFLLKQFSLRPLEICVHYFLHIECAPLPRRIAIGNHELEIDDAGNSIQVDVTDFVSLENNLLRIETTTPTAFYQVYLCPVRCDELDE